MKFEWDVFICHASEDKNDFVRPLANKLKSMNLKVWYDEFSLELGDSLRQSIDKGLAKSRYGIVVLSHPFFRKDWPQIELNGLVSKERNGKKVILPIWHGINKKDVIKYSPILSDRIAARSSEGLGRVVEKILKTIEGKNKATVIDNYEYYLSDLNREHKDLLISALKSKGRIYIIETDQTGRFIQIGDKDFIRDDNPEVRVRYLQALDDLIKYGLFFQETLRSYSLTREGFQLAKSSKIKSLMEGAWDLYKNGRRYEESIKVYQGIVNKHPGSGEAKEAQKMIGINYLHLCNYIKAEESLKEAIEMGNRFPSAYFYYGEALLKNRKFGEAEEAFKTSLSLPDTLDWIERKASEKIKVCREEKAAYLIKLSDEKFEIENKKINKEIVSEENNIKEKEGLKGRRRSSVLARKILDINLKSTEKKIEKKLKIDKEIIYGDRLIKTDDIDFLYKRLKKLANSEINRLKRKIERIYQECGATNFFQVDKEKIENEVDRVIKENVINLRVSQEKI